MVIDVITFNNEKELFDLRYNILKSYVDLFIVIEFDKTFSGKEKKSSFRSSYENVKYFFIRENEYSKYLENAKNSPNTEYGKGAEHWLREWMQKEYIKDVLEQIEVKDDDIVIIGDCDEIWDPIIIDAYEKMLMTISKLRLRVYTYYLNLKSNEKFYGPVISKWKLIKNKILNHVRSEQYYGTIDYWGWHFTSLAKYLRQKLDDSYTEQSYNTKWVQDHLDENIRQNKDFLGRRFKYKIDESQWPKYLKQNKYKYKNLLYEA